MATAGGHARRALALHFQCASANLEPDDRRAVLFDELCRLFATRQGADFLAARLSLAPASVYALDCDVRALLRAASEGTPDAAGANLVPALEHAPLEAAACIAAAAHATAFADANTPTEQPPSAIQRTAKRLAADPTQRVEALLRGAPVVSLWSIKAHAVGRLATVVGTALRVAPPHQLATTLAFRCGTCGFVQYRPLDTRKGYEVPTGCMEPGCSSRSFLPDLRRAHTVDVQRVTIQELNNPRR